MKKILTILLIIFMFNQISLIQSVKADDIFGNAETTEDSSDYDYQDTEEDTSVYEEENNNIDSNSNTGKELKNSKTIIISEIICGVVGIAMVIMAFKINESDS